MLQYFADVAGYFLCALIETTRAAYPKQYFGFLSLRGHFGHGHYLYFGFRKFDFGIILIFHSYLNITASYQLLTLFRPVKPVRITIFPRRAIVFYVTKHIVKACRCLRFFHHYVAAHFGYNFKRVNIYRTSLGAGIAAGTGPKFLAGYIIIQQRFIILVIFSVLIYVISYFGYAVAGIHHNFPWR